MAKCYRVWLPDPTVNHYLGRVGIQVSDTFFRDSGHNWHRAGGGAPAEPAVSDVFERLADEAAKANIVEVWGWSTDVGFFFGPAHPQCQFCTNAAAPSWSRLRKGARVCFRHNEALTSVEGTPPDRLTVTFVES